MLRQYKQPHNMEKLWLKKYAVIRAHDIFQCKQFFFIFILVHIREEK